MKDKFNQLAEKHLEEAYDLNLYLADNPEKGAQEYKAVKAFERACKKYGIKFEKNLLGYPTAFKAEVLKSPSDINICIIAEYDAMPNGHSCGHSASGAASLLTGLAFKDLSPLGFNLDLIGTPDEEGEGLKIPMADQGLFDKYDLAIMVHMHSKNKVACKSLALFNYDFVFTGKPAHATGAPWDGDNALNGLQLMIHAFDMMRQKLRDGSRVEGMITYGGEAINTIPAKAIGRYTFRTLDAVYLEEDVQPMVFDAARGAAMATQTYVQWKQYGYFFKEVLTLPTAEAELAELFASLDRNLDYGEDIFGSTDMGNVSYRCPALHPTMAITGGKDYGLHTDDFETMMRTSHAKDAILDSAKLMGGLIVRTVLDSNFRETIREEFEAGRK